MYINDLEYMGCVIYFKRIVKRTKRYRQMECEVNFYGKIMKGKAKVYKNGGAYFTPDRKRDIVFLNQVYTCCLDKENQPLSKRAIWRSSLKLAANILVLVWFYFALRYGTLLSTSFVNGRMVYVGYFYIIQILLATVLLIISMNMRKLVTRV